MKEKTSRSKPEEENQREEERDEDEKLRNAREERVREGDVGRQESQEREE